MYNHNIYDIKNSTGITVIFTGINGRGGHINLSLCFSKLCSMLLKQYDLNIEDFINKSRTDGSFEIDYSKKEGYTIYSQYGNICIGK